MPSKSILLFGVVFLAGIQAVHGAAQVSLTQETPCVVGHQCQLKCSLMSGDNQRGLVFYALVGQVVTCTSRDSCKSTITAWYHLNQIDIATSVLQILDFSASRDVGEWTCREDSSTSNNSTFYVHEDVPPAGLTFGRSCETGHATRPALLNCSLDKIGAPPATLLMTDSSRKIIGSSQTGSVTATVTKGGEASCSVTWSAFPNYPLNINPVSCDVQVFPSASAVGALNMTVREVQSLSLTCDAEGYPKPRITWSRQGSVKNVDVDDTVIRSILTWTIDGSEGVRQNVTCTASNPAGSAMVTFTLSLQYPPPSSPVISGLPPGAVVLKGNDVSLTCRVIGGNPPVSSVTLTCPRHSNTSQGVATRLEFTAGSKDQGSCVCSAFHILDYTLTTSVSLKVQEKSCDIAMPVGVTFIVTFILVLFFSWCQWKVCPDGVKCEDD